LPRGLSVFEPDVYAPHPQRIGCELEGSVSPGFQGLQFNFYFGRVRSALVAVRLACLVRERLQLFRLPVQLTPSRQLGVYIFHDRVPKKTQKPEARVRKARERHARIFGARRRLWIYG
jgi:hypothetical protein